MDVFFTQNTSANDVKVPLKKCLPLMLASVAIHLASHGGKSYSGLDVEGCVGFVHEKTSCHFQYDVLVFDVFLFKVWRRKTR